ncbi:MAG: hypothetical protein [Microvirus sp.]|nr:MAG: hypothetical protein [Microvirus sp.]
MTNLLPNRGSNTGRSTRPDPLTASLSQSTSHLPRPPLRDTPQTGTPRTRGPREAWGNVAQGVLPEQRAPPPK